MNNAIFEKLKEIMVSEFKCAPEKITLQANIADELELDSLDMVDLILALGDIIDGKIEPALFKDCKTVQDLVNSIQPFWK